MAQVLDAVFPIGCIYASATAVSPATLFGGTWAAIGAGKVLVGYQAGDPDFGTLGATGGEKTHTLTTPEIPSHTHTQNAHTHGVTDAGHTHVQNSHTHPSIQVQGGTTAATTGTHIMTSTATGGSSRVATSPEAANAATAVNQSATTGVTVNNATAVNQNTGGDGAHNNLQPFLVVQLWTRTA
jgi:microcystin-dependent protein